MLDKVILVFVMGTVVLVGLRYARLLVTDDENSTLEMCQEMLSSMTDLSNNDFRELQY